MLCEPDWDDEVDVVCTDSAAAGFATAISTVDADGEVFLAGLPAVARSTEMATHTSWFVPTGDELTDGYLARLTDDIDVAGLVRREADVPVRPEGEPIRPRRRPIPPFEGWRLRDWAARCIPSPSGYLYTQVTDWTSTLVDRGEGELFTVAEFGSLPSDARPSLSSVRDWLADAALERDITPYPVSGFDRLVFEEGVVVGAVFSTDSGPMAVRARHGVLICRDTTAPDSAPDGAPANPPRDAGDGRQAADGDLRVALVGKAASRFGRVELVTANPDGQRNQADTDDPATADPATASRTVTTW
ncbi:hypothetical protein FHR72_003111 [Mycolicibacterium iranicum]|uniref:Uncharacterized protein n=1 Tax=Mycolicibacterium iranicum TaxID=912594 RepID=A0A839QBP9_MYCIR|nr:hypothetical protein [Mycolicibacterium iranicum]MBB2991626.1 hypothetical protein [Mycolicibacterium iranicum]